jgi:hypothetical protein
MWSIEWPEALKWQKLGNSNIESWSFNDPTVLVYNDKSK